MPDTLETRKPQSIPALAVEQRFEAEPVVIRKTTLMREGHDLGRAANCLKGLALQRLRFAVRFSFRKLAFYPCTRVAFPRQKSSRS